MSAPPTFHSGTNNCTCQGLQSQGTLLIASSRALNQAPAPLAVLVAIHFSISRNRREGTQVQTFYQDQGAPSSPSAVAQRSHLAGAQAHLSLLATNTDQHVLHSSGHSTLQLDPALKDLRWQLTEHASAAMELKPDTGMCFISSSGQAFAACSFTVAVRSTTLITTLHNQHHISPIITDNMSGHGAAISHLPHQPTSATFCVRIPFSGSLWLTATPKGPDCACLSAS